MIIRYLDPWDQTHTEELNQNRKRILVLIGI